MARHRVRDTDPREEDPRDTARRTAYGATDHRAHDPVPGPPPPGRAARVLTGTAWAVLLLGLWLWARGVTDDGSGGAALGEVPAVGRQLQEGPPLPVPLDPVAGTARPVRLDVDGIGVHARVLTRSLARDGSVAAPPYADPGAVGWYGGGPTPGASGAAVVVGHVDTDRSRAVFYPLSSVKRGAKVDVARADGVVAEFTVESVDVVTRDRFDAARVYGPHRDGRAELRLLTCGGTFDRERRAYDANVVVSAYLTGTRSA
ncbi:class F sortase [Streptomyces sp. Z26]|uniref:class F sortase n=1 Tax=Streptomyces TaxID=1883 RepID=UPI0026D44CFA